LKIYVKALYWQVDAAVLQREDQKLVQQLEAQKSKMHALEKKFKDLKDKHNSYDQILVTMNRIWNQVIFQYMD